MTIHEIFEGNELSKLLQSIARLGLEIHRFGGDDPGPALVPTLAQRVRDLARGRALVSFVWLATDSAGPWRPIG